MIKIYLNIDQRFNELKIETELWEEVIKLTTTNFLSKYINLFLNSPFKFCFNVLEPSPILKRMQLLCINYYEEDMDGLISKQMIHVWVNCHKIAGRSK